MVHFGSFYKIPLFILFCGLQGCQYLGVGTIYFWAFDGIEIDLCGGFSIFRLVATFVMMTDTPDTIASKRTKGNNQSLVVPLCSLYSF